MPHEPIRILYVEDDPYDVVILQETLRRRVGFPNDYIITHAEDLAEGLNTLHEQQFDAVLLDLNLPESRGHRTVSIFKKHAPNLPIVCLTSFRCENLAMRSLEAGAQEFIVKGFGNADILNRVIKSAIFRHQNDLNSASFITPSQSSSALQ